jgi:hypothetical protein
LLINSAWFIITDSISGSKFIVEQAFQPVRKAGQTGKSVLQASKIGSTEYRSPEKFSRGLGDSKWVKTKEKSPNPEPTLRGLWLRPPVGRAIVSKSPPKMTGKNFSG